MHHAFELVRNENGKSSLSDVEENFCRRHRPPVACFCCPKRAALQMKLQGQRAQRTAFSFSENPGKFLPMVTLRAIAERRAEILRLAHHYRASHVRVFGSVARGDNAEGSDVDFLIKPEPGCSLFDLGGLLEDLQDLLGCRVDVVTEDGLKPRLRERVLREAVSL
jgi:predicted nucleotidyltransferase